MSLFKLSVIDFSRTESYYNEDASQLLQNKEWIGYNKVDNKDKEMIQ